MSKAHKNKIAFDVETSRVLQILSSEIYDSPKAFLRENVQNAYDAILMRCTAENVGLEAKEIAITVEPNRLTVSDNGIGMTETVLAENFWKAGSSGKRSELAQRAGVIGTFGIGAMANFGVCTSLRVETRHIESDVTLVTSVRRVDLRIAQDCVDLERRDDDRESGTRIVAELDPGSENGRGVCNKLPQAICAIPANPCKNKRRDDQWRELQGCPGERSGWLREGRVASGVWGTVWRTLGGAFELPRKTPCLSIWDHAQRNTDRW